MAGKKDTAVKEKYDTNDSPKMTEQDLGELQKNIMQAMGDEKTIQMRMSPKQLISYLHESDDEKDPEVKKVLRQLNWAPKEKEYRSGLDLLRTGAEDLKEGYESAVKTIENNYAAEIARLQAEEKFASNSDSDKVYPKYHMKDGAIDGAHGIARTGEGIIRRILKAPFHYIAEYSGGSLDLTPFISDEPNYSDGLFEHIKMELGPTEKGKKNYEALKAEALINKTEELETLENEYKSALAENKEYIGKAIEQILEYKKGKKARNTKKQTQKAIPEPRYASKLDGDLMPLDVDRIEGFYYNDLGAASDYISNSLYRAQPRKRTSKK